MTLIKRIGEWRKRTELQNRPKSNENTENHETLTEVDNEVQLSTEKPHVPYYDKPLHDLLNATSLLIRATQQFHIGIIIKRPSFVQSSHLPLPEGMYVDSCAESGKTKYFTCRVSRESQPNNIK